MFRLTKYTNFFSSIELLHRNCILEIFYENHWSYSLQIWWHQFSQVEELASKISALSLDKMEINVSKNEEINACLKKC